MRTQILRTGKALISNSRAKSRPPLASRMLVCRACLSRNTKTARIFANERSALRAIACCVACHLGSAAETQRLVGEGDELIAIITAIIRNKRRNMKAKSGGLNARRWRKSVDSAPAFQIPNS